MEYLCTVNHFYMLVSHVGQIGDVHLPGWVGESWIYIRNISHLQGLSSPREIIAGSDAVLKVAAVLWWPIVRWLLEGLPPIVISRVLSFIRPVRKCVLCLELTSKV